MSEDRAFDLALKRQLCEKDHLFFTRYFFKQRQGQKFIVNWHHRLIADTIDKIISGELQNVVINVSPGASKTELVVINLIARGLALNPRARFLHLSYSDDLASLNSATARDLIMSEQYQELWPRRICADSKSKKRWNIIVGGSAGGGVYATSIGGQVTGFRAGQMMTGFQGAILLDDLLKPDDAFSGSKLEDANRKLLTTIQSRKANPKTPIILIMQRVAESDPVGFIKGGNLEGDWHHVIIPSLLNKKDVPEKYRHLVDDSEKDHLDRFSYWPYKEPLQSLLSRERGDGDDHGGAKMSRHVFSSQYMQNPVALGGNLLKSEYFKAYSVLPIIKYRKIYADTAQKTAERNDFSVFECWGLGVDNNIYLLDLIRGKWEAPELQKRAIAFWAKHSSPLIDRTKLGALREMMVEDKSSGTGLVQAIRLLNQIPIKPIERVKDKLTRVYDAQPYIEMGQVRVPEDAPFTHDFLKECESFTADDSHDFDDQIDPCLDAVNDMIAAGNKLKQWEQLSK